MRRIKELSKDERNKFISKIKDAELTHISNLIEIARECDVYGDTMLVMAKLSFSETVKELIDALNLMTEDTFKRLAKISEENPFSINKPVNDKSVNGDIIYDNT